MAEKIISSSDSTILDVAHYQFGPGIEEMLRSLKYELGERTPIGWLRVLEALFQIDPIARPYAQIVPVLKTISDNDTIPGGGLASNSLGSGEEIFYCGGILKEHFATSARMAMGRTGTEAIYAQDLLFVGLQRCASLVAEMGQSAPQYQGERLTRDRTEMLAAEIALLSLQEDDRVESLLTYDNRFLEQLSISPDIGQSLTELRRRQGELDLPFSVIEPLAQNVALVLRDDPWQKGLRDVSGAGPEVAAFAAMLTARDFNPPLAIGVFGNWGTGKSFFMRMLNDAIEDTLAHSSDDPETLDSVVQIQFNAWHYAESNLWASIVDRIFTELDAWIVSHNENEARLDSLVEQLYSSKRLALESVQSLVSAKKKEAQAKSKLDAATQTLAAKRAQVAKRKTTVLKTAFETLLSTEENKKKITNAARTLGLGKLNESYDDFSLAARSLSDQSKIATSSVGALLGRLGWGNLAIIGLLFLIVPTLLTATLPQILQGMSAWLPIDVGSGTSFVAGVSGILAVATGALKFANSQATRAVSVIQKFEADLESEIANQSTDEVAEYASATKDLKGAEEEVALRLQAFKDASHEAEDATEAFVSNEPRQRLVQFLRKRVASGVYAQELSVIAAIRKDFEKLSALMASSSRDAPDTHLFSEEDRLFEAEINKVLKDSGHLLSAEENKLLRNLSGVRKKPPVTFERIVLYIDDLDRCPPDQVVAVLQAIHLLLAFPLFVVLIAVDNRWVLGALESHYGKLLAGDNGNASAQDYLEKIIQVPYRVRDVVANGDASMLNDLLGAFAQKTDAVGQGSQGEPGLDDETPKSQIKDSIVTRNVPSTAIANDASSNRKLLRLETEEISRLKRIDELHLWSPRRRLRFANSYLLIRASLPDANPEDLKDIAVLLASAEEMESDNAVSKLCRKLNLEEPSSKNIERLKPICERFSFHNSW